MNTTQTAAQRAASTSRSPRLAVVAGPGSGKTATIIERIRRLVDDGQDPRRVLAITFTNAGAREMEQRLQTITVDVTSPHLPDVMGTALETAVFGLGHCGTLHSFASKMLRQYGEALGYGRRLAVISPESAAELLALKAKALGCKEPLKKLLQIKSDGLHVDWNKNLPQTVVASFLGDLKADGIVDYDILLTEFEALLRRPEVAAAIRDRFDHLIVDEAQDSAPIDWRIYDLLDVPNKAFIGDPDQAIYGFRGGRVREMLEFLARPGTEANTLEENFRSTAPICASAQRLIEHNELRWLKRTISARGDDPRAGPVQFFPPTQNEGEEIAVVSRRIKDLIAAEQDPNEIAVLARTNAIAQAFQRTLAAIGLPVRKRVNPELPKDFALARAALELMAEPGNDTLAYLLLAAQGRARGKPESVAKREAREKVLQATAAGRKANEQWHLVPPAGAAGAPQVVEAAGGSREAVMWVAEIQRTLPAGADVAELALALAAPDQQAAEEGDGLHVLTMHAAKGREFDCVFVVGMEEETVPGRRKDTDCEEERRVVYVAATRARRFLAFSFCQSRVTPWGQIVPTTPSRFLAELASIPATNRP